MTAGLQVNLSVGTNIVKVKVTAPDTTTTETYTVNVVRVAVPVACSAASMTNRIWTGNLTVGQPSGRATIFGYAHDYGDLDNTSFSYEGTSYTINLVQNAFGVEVGFGLNAELGAAANDLVLHMGTGQFALADATYNSGTYSYTFSTNVPTWADGPDVSSVALTSDPGSDNTYGIGDDVTATVTFDAAVDITGTPQLELDFAGTAKAAACTAATNTTTMACSYTVVTGDSAPNGVAIGANKLTGGTIRATGSTTITADLTHVAVAIDAGHKVDGIRPTLVTAGNDAPTTSPDGTKVILTFSETISSVARSLITIQANSVTAATSAASAAGDKVELTLTTALTATATNLTVALAAEAVQDAVTNGNLALSATAVTNAVIANEPPEFSSPTATREVPENTAENTNIGTPLPAATDGDNDPLTYTLEGADAASFGFDPATRQLSTTSGVTYDYETKPSYAVTLKADDDNGGTGTIAVTIDLTDVEEPPGRPAAPSVTATAGTTDSLEVNWTAPSNTGPAIDNYDLRYREGTGGSWINGPQNVSGTSATIGSLTEGTSYQVQVLARNAEGDSAWSLPGSGQTGALGAPDVPHSLDATPGNGQVMLSWVQPSGGAEVTDYEYELDLSGTWISTGSTATDYTVRNLTNGQSYTFRVRAANSAGQSAASSASASVTPATVPGAPTGLSATVSDQRVDLIWTAPTSRPAPTPFHTDILPSRPAIYFYDTEGNPIAAESVVDITGDLEITEDGALTVQTEMEPLGVLTISTHGRGELVSGSARVVSDGPIGGMLRFEHPDLGVAGVGASPPLSDALFPVRRQEGGINTGVALHNLESSPGLLRCDLMREGVLLDFASIPLEANGQTSWLIDQTFPAADTSDFTGSVRCDAVGEGLFSAVALEMDSGTRIFAPLPVVPVPQMSARE